MFASPSPEGRGCREAAGEGCRNEKTLKKYLWYPSPGPLARATLPFGRGICQNIFPSPHSWLFLRKSKNLLRSRIVKTVPFRLETSVVDFVNTEKRQWNAHGMQRTWFGNLEHRLR